MTLKTPDKAKSSESNGVRVLIADDEPVSLRLFSHYLGNAGFEVIPATDGYDALKKMRPEIAVVVLDLNMPGMSGLECLRKIRAVHEQSEILIISGVGQIQDAVAAMKAGACEFVTKPCESDDFVAHVQQAIRIANLKRENRELRSVVEQPVSTSRYTATSEAACNLIQKLSKIAELDSTVVLMGESGTGKTTIARMIHDRGPRSLQPFVSVNCASLPRELIESELFGHVKGAYTGAVEDRPGRAEVADGGTLFLDEIGDLPLELQPKLLTFLQDRTLRRIGSNREIKVDVRVIAATHQDLKEMCNSRRFRPDLYYRLNVLKIEIPTLRDRRRDILDLSRTILERIAQRRGCAAHCLTPEALRLLQQHDWPGNIRELENVLERTSAFCDSLQIGSDDLDLETSFISENNEISTGSASYGGLTLKEIEKRALIETLKAYNGNKAMAARQLGISEKSIYNKLKRFNLFKTRNHPSS